MEEFASSRPGGKGGQGLGRWWHRKMRGLHAVPALAGFPGRGKKKVIEENSKMSVFIPQPYRHKSLSQPLQWALFKF